MLNSNALVVDEINVLEGLFVMGFIWRLSTHVDDGVEDAMVY